MNQATHQLSSPQIADFLMVLQNRFQKNSHRHPGLDWSKVQSKLASNIEKLNALYQMEETGGEPDVVALEQNTDNLVFIDCSPESPKGRRSLCYDRQALDSRKSFKPKNSVIDLAESMGVQLLTEDQYRHLQQLGQFDTKTSSWLKTPTEIRNLGGAIFADRRYNQVFVYHNGADSYYAARGFRSLLRL